MKLKISGVNCLLMILKLFKLIVIFTIVDNPKLILKIMIIAINEILL